MTTIHKFQLQLQDGPQAVLMPYGAEVLHIADQGGTVCLWALVSENSHEPRFFQVYGTGYPITEGWSEYVGSVQQLGGALVWHVFEVGNPNA